MVMIFILSVGHSGIFIFTVQNDPNIVVTIYLCSYTLHVCGNPLLTVYTLCPIASLCVYVYVCVRVCVLLISNTYNLNIYTHND